MGEERPKTIHTNVKEERAALRKLWGDFTRKVERIIDSNPKVSKHWQGFKPETVKKLRKELLELAKEITYREEKRIKEYEATGEARPAPKTAARIALLAAICEHHNQKIYDAVTGAESWEL